MNVSYIVGEIYAGCLCLLIKCKFYIESERSLEKKIP